MGWQQGSFRLLIVNAGAGFTGIFIYAPSPGAGTLIGSWAAQDGTDPYGNAYPAGLSSELGNLSGQTIIASVFQGVNLRIDENGIFLYQTVSIPVPPPPPPVPYFVGGNAIAAGTSTIVCQVTNPTSAGDTLHVAANAAFGTSTVLSATDSKGNIYSIKVSDNVQIPATCLIADNTNNALGTKALATSDTVTVTYSGTTGAKTASVAGVSGINANPFDAAATPLNSDGSSISPSLTSGGLAQAAEVCIATLSSSNAGGAPNWGAGWVQLDRQQLGSGQFLSIAYQDVSSVSPVTVSATLAASGRWAILLAPLKE